MNNVLNPTASDCTRIVRRKSLPLQALCLVFFVVCCLTSCNPIYYSPNSHNVPLLTKSGEASLTAAGNADQLEFQGAYAVTDKIGLQAQGGLFRPSEEENGTGGSGHFIEAGAGYLHPFGTHWIMEGYGLVGLGRVENHFRNDAPGPTNPTVGDLKSSIFRWGIQPNLGYKSPYFSAAMSTRLVHLLYHDVEGDLIYNNVDQVSFLQENNSYVLFEPALTLRGGFKKVKLQLQICLSYNITDPDFFQDGNLVTLGLHFNL